MKTLLLTLSLLYAVSASAQYRPIVMSTVSLNTIAYNFNQAAIWANKKLDKYGNDTIYGSPTFTKKVIFKSSNTFSGTNIFTSSVTFDIPSTSSFTRTCPTGFTSIQRMGNQLGCVQTSTNGTGSYYAAIDACYNTFGARLPSYQEARVAIGSYTLTNEGIGREWTSGTCYDGAFLFEVIDTDLTVDWVSLAGPYGYRCWIPR